MTSPSHEVRSLLSSVMTAATNPETIQRLQRADARLDDPLTIAIVGEEATGKSTVAQVLMESLVLADQPTTHVTWYRWAPSPAVHGLHIDGSIRRIAFLGGEDAPLLLDRDSVGPPDAQIIVEWPCPALEDLAIIDTPGFDHFDSAVREAVERFTRPTTVYDPPLDGVILCVDQRDSVAERMIMLATERWQSTTSAGHVLTTIAQPARHGQALSMPTSQSQGPTHQPGASVFNRTVTFDAEKALIAARLHADESPAQSALAQPAAAHDLSASVQRRFTARRSERRDAWSLHVIRTALFGEPPGRGIDALEARAEQLALAHRTDQELEALDALDLGMTDLSASEQLVARQLLGTGGLHWRDRLGDPADAQQAIDVAYEIVAQFRSNALSATEPMSILVYEEVVRSAEVAAAAAGTDVV